jgi:hypothetical protein
VIEKVKALRADGATVPEIMRLPSLARPVSIGHLGAERKLRRLARFDGLTMGICDECGERLIEIDFYGERLTGCVECNKWGRIGDKNRVLELKEDDLSAVMERPRT